MSFLPRFSMRTMLIVLTLLIMGIAATAANHRAATSFVYTLNWILLGLSLAGALLAVGPPRRFWVGFAIFAWIHWYFAAPFIYSLSNDPFSGARSNDWSSPQNSGLPLNQPVRLVTVEMIHLLEGLVARKLSVGDEVYAQYSSGGLYPGVIDAIENDLYLVRWTDGSSSPAQWTTIGQIQYATTAFRDAAYNLLCSLWGLFGGLLAYTVFATRDKKNSSAKSSPAETAVSTDPRVGGNSD